MARLLKLTLAARVSAGCDVCLAVGTSALVYPAASQPITALQSGAIVAEINPHPTPFTNHAQFALAGSAGVILPEVVSALRVARGG
jgi:NAD-dependent deacetylase